MCCGKPIQLLFIEDFFWKIVEVAKVTCANNLHLLAVLSLMLYF